MALLNNPYTGDDPPDDDVPPVRDVRVSPSFCRDCGDVHVWCGIGPCPWADKKRNPKAQQVKP